MSRGQLCSSSRYEDSRAARLAITCIESPRFHAVLPVAMVVVEVGFVGVFGETVEFAEEIKLRLISVATDRRRKSSIRTLGLTFSWM